MQSYINSVIFWSSWSLDSITRLIFILWKYFWSSDVHAHDWKKNFKWLQPSYKHLILLVPLPKHDLKIWTEKWCRSDYETLLKIILSLSAILESMCNLKLLLVISWFCRAQKQKLIIILLEFIVWKYIPHLGKNTENI